MRLSIISWKGVNINDGTNYISDFADNTPLVSSASVVGVDMLDAPPFPAARRLSAAYVTFIIQPQGVFRTQRETIRDLFKTEEKLQFYTLLVADQDDSNRQWYLEAAVLSVAPSNNAFIVILTPKYPYWRTAAVSASQSYTASAQSKNFTVATPSPHKVHPKLTLTVTGAKTGAYNYERWIPVKSTGIATGVIPFDFGAGINTATLVSGGKMQADGDDCRLLINGFEVPRFLGNFNTTATKIWAYASFPAIKPLPLKTAMLSGDTVTSLSFTDTPANRLEFAKWPSSGEVVIGSEGFRYTTKNDALLRVDGVTRAIKSTVAAGHSAGDSIYFQPFDVRLIYGNSSATNPGYDTSHNLLDFTASTNTSWVFDRFGHWDGQAFPAWTGPKGVVGLVYGNNTYILGNYTGLSGSNQMLYTAVGTQMVVAFVGGAWRAVTLDTRWVFNPPYRMTGFVISGFKYRWLTYWPSFVLAYGETEDVITNDYAVPTPSAVDANQAWNRTNASLPDKTYLLIFFTSGSIPAEPYNLARAEIAEATITFNSADVPTCLHAPEANTYEFDLEIKNTTTGSTLYIKKKIERAVTIIIDTREHTVKVNNIDSSGGVIPLDKRVWFEMQAGTNSIVLTDTGMTGVTLNVIGDAERGV